MAYGWLDTIASAFPAIARSVWITADNTFYCESIGWISHIFRCTVVCQLLKTQYNGLSVLIGIALLLYVAYSLKTGYFLRKPSLTSLSEWGKIAVQIHKDECPGSYWSGNAFTVLFAFVLFYSVASC